MSHPISRADLRCYYCGHAAGRIERELGSSAGESMLLLPAIGPGAVRTIDGRIRCGRCGGPLFMDEAEVFRYSLPFVDDEPPPRRGRPRRTPVIALASSRDDSSRIRAQSGTRVPGKV